jgi:hypothetical protein
MKYILISVLLVGCTCSNDYEFRCFDGHVYYKQSKDQDFWYKTGRECK